MAVDSLEPSLARSVWFGVAKALGGPRGKSLQVVGYLFFFEPDVIHCHKYGCESL